MTPTPERPTLRGPVTVSLGGQAVTVPVCHCGELLIGPADALGGIRCRYRECRTWYSADEIRAAMTAAHHPTTEQAA